MVLNMSSLKRNVYAFRLRWKEKRGQKPIEKDQSFVDERLNSTLQNGTDLLNNEIITEDDGVNKISLMEFDYKCENSDCKPYILRKIRTQDWPLATPPNPPYKNVLPATTNGRVLVEPVHFLIVNGSIIIAEVNKNSVSVARHLERALNLALPPTTSGTDGEAHDMPKAVVIPIMRSDQTKRLNNMKDLKNIGFMVAPGKSSIFRKSKNSVLRTANIPAAIEKNTYISISIHAGRSDKRKGYLQPILQRIKSTFSSNPDGYKKSYASFKVNGIDNEGNEILLDLIKDKFKYEVEVKKIDDVKAVESPDMYNKLETIYSSHRDEFS